jgi:hypothetical protein
VLVGLEKTITLPLPEGKEKIARNAVRDTELH